jgi:hypothetical protein
MWLSAELTLPEFFGDTDRIAHPSSTSALPRTDKCRRPVRLAHGSIHCEDGASYLAEASVLVGAKRLFAKSISFISFIYEGAPKTSGRVHNDGSIRD